MACVLIRCHVTTRRRGGFVPPLLSNMGGGQGAGRGSRGAAASTGAAVASTAADGDDSGLSDAVLAKLLPSACVCVCELRCGMYACSAPKAGG
jgi:hypothetical protein